jgi:hypothetical protein
MNKSRTALLLCGGWDGHYPEQICALFSEALTEAGFHCEHRMSLDALADQNLLSSFSLIFPCWTMGALTKEQAVGLEAAIRGGVGLGGIHGGMGDAFRGCTNYEWMVGGHFVGHPHVGPYTVQITSADSPITAGMPKSFEYTSEQYYMLVDPAIRVLAEADYTYEGTVCKMPVVWTKPFGEGRVFYNALGHHPQEFTDHPGVLAMTIRGLLWAARSN